MPWSCLPTAHLLAWQAPRPRFATQARKAIGAGVTLTSRQALEPWFTLGSKKAKDRKLKNPRHYETDKLNAELCLPRAFSAMPAEHQVPRKETGRSSEHPGHWAPGSAQAFQPQPRECHNQQPYCEKQSGRQRRSNILGEGQVKAFCICFSALGLALEATFGPVSHART